MHYCVPNKDSLPPAVVDNWHEVSRQLLSSKGVDPINDLYKARWVIVGSVFVGIFYTFIFMKFMDKCAL
jgi:hypothetical protein